MEYHSRVMLAYSAWKSLKLAQGFLAQGGLSADVSIQMRVCENELRANLDLLPTSIQDEITAHFRRLEHDWRAGYGKEN